MKIVIAVIYISLVAAGGYLGVRIVHKTTEPGTFDVAPETIVQPVGKPRAEPRGKQLLRSGYDPIIKRNLFKVDRTKETVLNTGEAPKNMAAENLKKTELKLVLWGTVTGEPDIYAVIEDKKTRKQLLYQVGDVVQGATIKKIARRQVILHHQGEDQILEMSSGSKNTNSTAKSSSAPLKKQLPAPVNDIITTNVPINGSIDVDQLKNQIKFRPRFTGGKPDGVMVYGIRANSVFMKMGLRNGDIIKTINGVPVESSDNASRLFREVEPDNQGKLMLIRRGKQQEINFNFNNNGNG